jgi:hypothetical protein
MLLAVSDEAVIALAGVFAGGLVQSATGFGYAIVAAPLLAAAYGPFVTAPTVNVLALLANVLTLTTERRPLQVDRGLVVRPISCGSSSPGRCCWPSGSCSGRAARAPRRPVVRPAATRR